MIILKSSLGFKMTYPLFVYFSTGLSIWFCVSCYKRQINKKIYIYCFLLKPYRKKIT